MHFNWFIVCRRCTICMTTIMCVMNRRAINIRNKYTGWGNSLSGHITLCPCYSDTSSPCPTLSKFKVARGNDSFPLAARSGNLTAAVNGGGSTYMKVNEPSGDSHAANYDRLKKISRHRIYDERGKFQKIWPKNYSGENFRMNYTSRDVIL